MPLYLHGFASGPSSSKALHFKARAQAVGLALAVPALDEGDFERLTLTGMLALVGRLAAAEEGPRVLFGSSLGGYVAALHASRQPVDALVLLAPAVDFARRLEERTPPAELARWRSEGKVEVDHFAHRRRMPIGHGLLADAVNHEPWPRVQAPTLVLHGRRDEVVPLEAVSRWTAAQPHARLVTFASGHELVDVMDAMFDEAAAFLAGIPAIRARWPGLAG